MRTAGRSEKPKFSGSKEVAPQWLMFVRSPAPAGELRQIKSPFGQAFGFPVSELDNPHRNFDASLHPADRPRLQEALRLVQANGKGSCTYRVRHADGRYHRWHEEVRVCSCCDDPGSIWVSCVVSFKGPRPGIRLLRAAQARLEGFLQACSCKPVETRTEPDQLSGNHLRRREELLDLALRRASDGLWDWDLRTDELYYSPRWKELAGYEDHELPNHLSTWLKLVHPEDRDRTLRASMGFTAGLEPRMELEFRLRHKEGRWVNILSRGFLVRDEQGRPSRLVGSNVDITPLREAEAYLREANVQLENRVQRSVEGYRSAVAALAESEARLRLALRASRAGAWRWDAVTNTSWWDDLFREQYGFNATQPSTLAQWVSSIHPEDRKRIEERIRVLCESSSDSIWDEEFRVIHPANGVRWMHELGDVVRDDDGHATHFHGINLDTTERKHAEAELRRLNETLEERVQQRTESLRTSEQRFRSLAEASFEGIMLSHGGVIVDCNDQLTRILGCSRDKLVGRTMMGFVPPEWHERVMERIRDGQDAQWEHEIICPDGRRRIVETHGRSPDGPCGQRMTAVRDVTERRQMEAELALQRQELERFRRLAELSEISTGIIHQIGQPLTAIINNVAAAKSFASRCPNPQCAARETLLDSDSSLKLVQLTMSRLRALVHPEQAHREPTDVNALVCAVVELIQGEEQSSGITFSTELGPNLPRVALDDVQLSQALINLLRNACEAVASCDPARREVKVSTRLGATGELIIEVMDRGHGITAASSERMFEPFFTTKPEGMGVGLSLSRRILDAHSGSLTAINNLDGPGATFRITLGLDGGGAA